VRFEDPDGTILELVENASGWSPDCSWLVGGPYTNRLRRTIDGWRISRLGITITWQQNR